MTASKPLVTIELDGELDTVINLGAGVQSTAMALMYANGELELPAESRSVRKLKDRTELIIARAFRPPTVAIFADTQWEPRATYEHLTRLEAALAVAPHPITVRRVTKGSIRDDAVARVAGERGRYANLPLYIEHGRGGAEGKVRRQCTREYKIEPLLGELRALGYGPKRPVASLVGISLDEFQRVKPGERWQHRAHPLTDARLTRHDLALWLERNGWPSVPKSACIGCPMHDNRAWRALRDQAPDEFADAVAFDASIRRLPGMKGETYLHRSLVPLDEVDLTNLEDHGQGSLFGDECEGACGV